MLLAGGGAVCLVPDATFIRLSDAGDLQTVFWRSLFIGISLVLVTVARHGTGTVCAYRSMGRPGTLVSLLWGLQLLLFVYAVNHTAVANALVILATAPFCAALFTRLLIGEAIHARTWLAMAAAIGGVVLTFASALRLGGMDGNLAALGVAVAMGLNFTVIRRAGRVDMVPAVSLAGFVAAAVALPVAWPVGITARDAVVIGVMGLVLVPAAFTLLTLGSRYVPSPEVTLLMTIETVFGPILAWTVVDEAPPPLALVGGAIVVATLVLHSRAALRQPTERKPSRAAEGTPASNRHSSSSEGLSC